MDRSNNIRAFIAMDVGPEVRERVFDLSERLRKGVQFTGARAKWTRPEAFHLTLNFLGSIAPRQVDEVRKTMERVCARTTPITLTVRGLGVFPNEFRPRVLWVGIKRGADETRALQARMSEELARLGFKSEERPFTPHLTLARFKSNRGAKALADLMKPLARQFCGEVAVQGLTLYRSILKPEGARYSVLAEAPFAATSPDADSAASRAASPDNIS